MYGFARKRAPSGSSNFTLGGSAPDALARLVRERWSHIGIAKLDHRDGFDAVPSFEDEIAGILKDVRDGHPHDHLVLNDEDDDRLALARRLQGRSPGFPGETPIPSPILLLI